ncbi:MAG: NTP transferase domain-containing protein [Geobacter sp.]|nr:NTP transferase domain-containing protein [Geobacter sp.]
MTGQVAAILLAAGKSRRMGSCKQLLPLGDTTLVGRCLDTLIAAGLSEIIVVVSPEGIEVAEAARRYPVEIVVNSRAGGDMASSVRRGRDAVSSAASAVLVALCDCPLLLPATVSHLMAEHGRCPAKIIIPCHDGRRGHPLLIPRSILDELSDSETLRDLVRCDPGRVCCVEVNDPGVLIDMDTPEDYHKICETIGSV